MTVRFPTATRNNIFFLLVVHYGDSFLHDIYLLGLIYGCSGAWHGVGIKGEAFGFANFRARLAVVTRSAFSKYLAVTHDTGFDKTQAYLPVMES